MSTKTNSIKQLKLDKKKCFGRTLKIHQLNFLHSHYDAISKVRKQLKKETTTSQEKIKEIFCEIDADL